MKKIITLIALMFMYCNMWAQNDQEISWLVEGEDPTTAQVYSTSITMSVQGYMEFDYEDILNFKFQGEKIAAINQIKFHLDASTRSTITSFGVSVRKGADISNSTSVRIQTIDIANLVDDWNTCVLDSSVIVDLNPGEKLFVGCQFAFKGKEIPLSIVEGTNAKQSLIYLYSSVGYDAWYNFTTAYATPSVLLIKAVAEMEEAVAEEISLESVNIPYHDIVDARYPIIGVVKNLGSDTLTSFKMQYKMNDLLSSVQEITDLNVAPGETYTFTSDDTISLDEVRTNKFSITVSEPNGISDLNYNNEIETSQQVYAYAEQRIVLHEAFSSSTCNPCKGGNEYLKRVLDSIKKNGDTDKTTIVKYQMNFPGSGDPYYTSESSSRANATNYNVNGVPTLILNGPTTLNSSPYDYNVEMFNSVASIPAATKMNGTATVDTLGHKVSFNVDIEPATNLIIGSNLRFFAVIVEKWTEKNVKTNGETIFYNVAKKFMTSASGNRIDSLKLGDSRNIALDYTFKGDYRLPSNASSPISHTKEHSVEDFSRLKVVYWIQNTSTGEVYQAGEADPFPEIQAGISGVNTINANMNIYPNPIKGDVVYVNIESKEPIKGYISVYDIVGNEVSRLPQEIYSSNQTVSIDISNLSSGVYFIRLNTKEGATTKKLIVTK